MAPAGTDMKCDVDKDDLPGIAAFVAQHLPQWRDADRSAIKAESVSGAGFGPSFKVTASVEPHTVCFKLRVRDSDEPAERILSLGASALARSDAAPQRFVAGPNWWVEEWGGIVLAEADIFDAANVSAECAGRCGELLGRIHSTAVEWYDLEVDTALFKDIEARVGKPVPHDGPLGWFVRLLGPWFPGDVTDDGLKEMCLEWPELLAPQSAAAKRRVTTHGDFHVGNILLAPRGELIVVDFDFVGVNLAVFDVAYHLQHVLVPIEVEYRADPEDRGDARRAFVKAYLAASGLPDTSKDVAALIVDAEIYRLGMCIRSPLYNLLQRAFPRLSSDLCKESNAAYREFVAQVRQSAELQAEVVAYGIFGCIEKSAPKLAALQKRAHARLCTPDSGYDDDFLSGKIPYFCTHAPC